MAREWLGGWVVPDLLNSWWQNYESAVATVRPLILPKVFVALTVQPMHYQAYHRRGKQARKEKWQMQMLSGMTCSGLEHSFPWRLYMY